MLKFVESGRARFCVCEAGCGPALVLLHGFPLDHRIWDEQVAALSDAYRVIAPDLSGFGQSTTAGDFSINSLADDVHELLTKLGALPCVLAGLSMGGYVAQAYVRRHAHDLKGLVLLDTKAEADDQKGREGRVKMAQMAREGGSRPVAEQMMPKMLAPSSYTSRPAVVEKLRTIMESCPPLTIERACMAMRDRDDYTTDLDRIVTPTLLIFGADDAISPVSIGRFIQSRMPRAELAVIPDAGHLAPMEQPAAVTDALRQWIRRVWR